MSQTFGDASNLEEEVWGIGVDEDEEKQRNQLVNVEHLALLVDALHDQDGVLEDEELSLRRLQLGKLLHFLHCEEENGQVELLQVETILVQLKLELADLLKQVDTQDLEVRRNVHRLFGVEVLHHCNRVPFSLDKDLL